MNCPKCKTEYPDGFVMCSDCGVPMEATLSEGSEELCVLNDNAQTGSFKKNFWSAFGITFLSALFLGIGIIPGFLICFFIWLDRLIKKKKGAHGWIVGTLLVPVIALLVIGACTNGIITF